MAQSTNIGAPAECNFERRRSNTKDIAIRLLQDGAQIPDATGYAALFTINTVKDPDAGIPTGDEIFQATGVPNSPASDGILRFDFAAFDQSPEIAPGNYFYDVELTDPDGETSTPLIGKFIVKQDITK
jgi:hypothetical protein